jgi:hypothetical protein
MGARRNAAAAGGQGAPPMASAKCAPEQRANPAPRGRFIVRPGPAFEHERLRNTVAEVLFKP